MKNTRQSFSKGYKGMSRKNAAVMSLLCGEETYTLVKTPDRVITEGNDMIEIKDIKSSVILGAAYDPKASTLAIVLRGGSSYLYENVPREAFDAFKASESLGAFFAKHIRPNVAYRCIRLGKGAEDEQ
jgi:hypothetical protein